MSLGVQKILNFLVRSTALICLVMFGWGGIDAALDVYYGRASGMWPTTPGVVTRSRVYTETERVVGRRGLRTRTRQKSKLDFAYRYSVAGQTYEGQRISYDADRSPGGGLITAPFSAGQPVLVSYDPSNPSRGVLQPGVSRRNYSLNWLCVSVVAISAYVALFGLRHAVMMFTKRPRTPGRRGFEPVIADRTASGNE